MHKSPVHDFHLKHGAQMVEYAGWEMPIRYASIQDEHRQTRESGSVFDVSHMGRIEIKGLHAQRLLERICSRRIGTMQEKQCRYTLICNETGGVLDDAVVMKMDDDEFLLVCNGANREKIAAHIDAVVAEHADWKVKVEDKTLKTAMVAIQGPKVMDLISSVSKEIPGLKRWRFTTKNLMIIKAHVSRTGYTGEDGVEVILPSSAVGMAMRLLLQQADPDAPDAPIKPAGLGARDTLRLEAGMPLYGHELGEDINALACGMGFAVSLDKTVEKDGETFIGQEALQKTADAGGPEQTLVGLILDTKRTARQGMAVHADGTPVGAITSGCASPTLGKSIAMAYVDNAHAAVGTTLAVDCGREQASATIVELPFYKAK
ncbi:MAG: aminomethyltransferase [Phycisphaeraceae bacterium]|nr:MAG: aminomethyltransferase [Phycisphaeraceae bacterium]